MREMTRPRDTPAAAVGITPAPPSLPGAATLWSGAVLCAIGLLWNRTWEHWAGGRLLELLALALASLAFAWPLRRFARWEWATALAVVWCSALPVFAGPLPVAAVVLVAATAATAGGLVAGSVPAALACAAGLALLAGALGWLLPLPLHSRWSYLALCVVFLLLGRQRLQAQLRCARDGWSEAVASQPRAAALALLALGLASTGCWLPTMQFDDLAYHLGLPWQLAQEGRYAMDPTHQIWALAPWAADVQQAVPQLIAGAEARGPMNALWIAITAAGLWRLCASLGAAPDTRWAAVALYASLPLTAGLAAGMQTETPTTALVVWLAWLIVEPEQGPAARPLLVAALLVGGLISLKLMGAVYAVVLLAWAALARRPWAPMPALLGAAVAVAGVGLSSYAYATAVAGNPFLPLFNAWFGSPYLGMANFDDPRWHAGFSLLLPWQLTFQTQAYSETLAGSAGFALVALAGAWVLALLQRGLRGFAFAATAMFLMVLLPLQYLRYAFPAMALLVSIMAIATARNDPRRGIWLLATVALLGFAFQANGNWMQRTGALKQAVLAGGSDAPLLAKYAPERLLAQQLRRSGGPSGKVLVMDAGSPAYAEFGLAGRTTAAYDAVTHPMASAADADLSGKLWLALLRREPVSEVILRPDAVTGAQAAGLRLAGARKQAGFAAAEWWRIPAGDAP